MKNRLVSKSIGRQKPRRSRCLKDAGSVIFAEQRRAVIQMAEGTMTLWMLDLERRATTPFVITGGSSQAPVWSSDGKHVFYGGHARAFAMSTGSRPTAAVTKSG